MSKDCRTKRNELAPSRPATWGLYANKWCALLMRLRVHNKKKGVTQVRKSQRTMRQGNKENCETGVEIEIVNDTGVRGNRSGSVRQETRG